MKRYEDPKEMSRAMNGKMLLMLVGAILVFTGFTSTMIYGVNMFSIAGEAVKGTEEYVEALAQIGMSITAARIVGVAFFVTALAEIVIGVACVILQNRLDKSFLARKLVLVLLAVEILMNVYLFTQGLWNIGRMISSLALPLFLLWAASSLCKLARKYPDRILAVDTKSRKTQSKPAPKKSLKERAMVPGNLAAEEHEEQEEQENHV